MILKPVLGLALLAGVLTVLAFPWTIPFPGRTTLSGNWLGELRSSAGPTTLLFIRLQPDSSYSVRILGIIAGQGARLGGTAAVCTSRQRIEYYVTGYTTVRSGKELDILLKPVRAGRPELRLDLKGRWDGHTLQLTELNSSLADVLGERGAPREPENSPESIAGTMNRGTAADFDSACAKLR